MVENVKAVHNPLTIIAIFAALAEVAGTVALSLVDKNLQAVFVWFVMGFPVLLVVAFFLTLNLNRAALYAPSDYSNEENFMNTLARAQGVSASLDLITEQLEDAKQQILEQATQQAAAIGSAQHQQFSQLVAKQLNAIEQRLDTVRNEAQQVAAIPSNSQYPQSSLQAQILKILSNSKQGMTRREIAEEIGQSILPVAHALMRLQKRSMITLTGDPRNPEIFLVQNPSSAPENA